MKSPVKAKIKTVITKPTPPIQDYIFINGEIYTANTFTERNIYKNYVDHSKNTKKISHRETVGRIANNKSEKKEKNIKDNLEDYVKSWSQEEKRKVMSQLKK